MTLISFDKELIFIKTVKTAGTSIEVDLSQRLEEAAIVTPIFPEYPGHEARNYLDESGEAQFYNHMPATRIRELLGVEIFERFTKICVQRDPVDTCISYFHMLHNSPDHRAELATTWESFFEAKHFPMDFNKIAEVVDGQARLLVDRVIRYDRLQSDLPLCLAELGIPDFKLTARAKSEYSKNQMITAEQVPEQQRAEIYAAFEPVSTLCGLDWT